MLLVIKRSFTSVLAVGALAAALLAGCSSNAASSADSAASDSSSQSARTTQALGPIMKDPSVLEGTTVTLPVERELVFTVDEADIDRWGATIADGSIAEFVPGKTDGSATYNPGIHPLAEGETTVELTAPDGTTTTFSLIVTPGAR